MDVQKLPFSEVLKYKRGSIPLEGKEITIWPRKTTDEKWVQELVKILEMKGKEGDLDPIIIGVVGEEKVVLEGHHRIRAYELAGRREIPVKFVEVKDWEEARKLAIKYNLKGKKPLNGKDKKRMARELYRDGYTQAQIAELLEVSVSTVSRWLKETEERKKRIEEKRKKIQERMRRVQELARQGLSVREIAEKLGVSPATVSKVFSDLQVQKTEHPAEAEVEVPTAPSPEAEAPSPPPPPKPQTWDMEYEDEEKSGVVTLRYDPSSDRIMIDKIQITYVDKSGFGLLSVMRGDIEEVVDYLEKHYGISVSPDELKEQFEKRGIEVPEAEEEIWEEGVWEEEEPKREVSEEGIPDEEFWELTEEEKKLPKSFVVCGLSLSHDPDKPEFIWWYDGALEHPFPLTMDGLRQLLKTARESVEVEEGVTPELIAERLMERGFKVKGYERKEEKGPEQEALDFLEEEDI